MIISKPGYYKTLEGGVVRLYKIDPSSGSPYVWADRHGRVYTETGLCSDSNPSYYGFNITSMHCPVLRDDHRTHTGYNLWSLQDYDPANDPPISPEIVKALIINFAENSK